MAQFKGMLHLLHKRMANVSYPISKQEILEQIGDEIVKVDIGTLFKCTGDHRTDPAGNGFPVRQNFTARCLARSN